MSETVAAAAPLADPSPQPAGEALYGGFWVRFCAYFVDFLIVSLISVGASAGLMLVVSGKFTMDNEIPLAGWAIGWIYQACFLSSPLMGTPGKRLFGLYVTDLEGRRLELNRAAGRYLASAVSGLLLGIGYVMIAFTDRNQGLHDRWAGTLVRRRPGGSPAAMIFFTAFVFLAVFVGGIIYWVGVPAVRDLVVKDEMKSLYQIMSANKVPIQEYALKNRAWPTTWEQVESAGGKNPMNSMEATTKQFVRNVSMEQDASMVAVVEINGKSGKLRLAPQRVKNALGWNCNASADIVQYMPENCGALQ
jgi:uncharacterized RDD family membrane protein YckC